MKTKVCRTSFATQYTSLMLIILSVVVSSRFQLFHQEQAHAQATSVKSQRVPPSSIGLMKISDLFEKSSPLLNEDSVEALLTLITSHDVNLFLTVYLPFENAGEMKDQALSLALARAMHLKEYFSSKAPEGAVRITVIEEQAGTLTESVQATARFTRSGSKNNPWKAPIETVSGDLEGSDEEA